MAVPAQESRKRTQRPVKRSSSKAASRKSAELTAAQAAESAIDHMVNLTTNEPVGVSGVEPADDGWRVEVDMIEERRIPSSSDMIALYEVDLDASGELTSYRRAKRYVRGRADLGDGMSS